MEAIGLKEDATQNDRVISQFTLQSKHFHSKEYSLSSQEYLSWAVQRMPLFKSARVIDVAAGTGLLSLAVSPYVKSVKAVDITKAMLDEGRKEAKKRAIENVEFCLKDAYHLNENSSFDIAMSRLAFHHLSDPKAVLGQMIEAVSIGGAVIVLDLLSPEDNALSQRYNEYERLRDDSHTVSLTAIELKGLFESAGLLDIKTNFRYVVNDLDAWMTMTQTSEEHRQTIKKAMEAELSGGEPTGFQPFIDESGRIKFAHHWMMIEGKKPIS